MSLHSSQARADLHEAKRTKASVRAASTANVTTSSPGTALDGVTLSSGDRILLKDQTTGSQNGIYVWTASGSALTRATDASASSDMLAGDQVYVREGTANGGTNWQLTTSAAITLGTTALTYASVGSTDANQSANTVKAGPTTGSAAAPTYRALVAADLPVMVASGASHKAGAAPDPGSSAGTTKFLREDASWQVPAGGASMTPSVNQLAADVTIVSANTYVDGPSLSLTAGKWLLIATISFVSGNNAGVTGKLWDGTTSVAVTQYTAQTSTSAGTMTLVGYVNPGSTTTYKFSAASTVGTSTTVIKAAAPNNSPGNFASTLVAVPLP